MRGMDEAVKALAGRRGPAKDSERLLLPMGFREFWRATSHLRQTPDKTLHINAWEFREPSCREAIGQLLPWFDDLVLGWEAFLTIGGYPRSVSDFLRTSEVQPDFTNALWDVISGEGLRRARDFPPAKAQLLLALLAGALTEPLNLTSLGADLGTAASTSRERVEDLVAAFTCWPCYPISPRGHPDHAAPSGAHPKCYFTDPLLARLACQRDPDNIRCPDPSVLSEQQFGLTLVRQRENLQPGSYSQFASVMYARVASKEVDFTGPWMKNVAFESKYVDSSWKREARTLRALTDQGVILTRGILDLEEEVWAVPVSVAAWLLDPPPRSS
jgi:predicted AAA+ superfamily ATPase